MNEIKQISLVDRTRKHESKALAAIYEYYYPKVLKYMYYRVEAIDAEDLTADVFVKVLQGIHHQNGSLVAWLYAIAGNVVRDYIRAKKVRRISAADNLAAAKFMDNHYPVETVVRQTEVRNAMKQLSEGQRELVVLKFIQSLSNSDIADITGRTPEAIRALQYRALSALRKILSDKEGNTSG